MFYCFIFKCFLLLIFFHTHSVLLCFSGFYCLTCGEMIKYICSDMRNFEGLILLSPILLLMFLCQHFQGTLLILHHFHLVHMGFSPLNEMVCTQYIHSYPHCNILNLPRGYKILLFTKIADYLMSENFQFCLLGFYSEIYECGYGTATAFFFLLESNPPAMRVVPWPDHPYMLVNVAPSVVILIAYNVTHFRQSQYFKQIR